MRSERVGFQTKCWNLFWVSCPSRVRMKPKSLAD
jgi:hypothetical protein